MIKMTARAIPSTGGKGTMANLAGGAAGGGGGGDEEDIPDVRFLLRLPKIKEPYRSKKWLVGNLNSPSNQKLTLEEKEKYFIDFLELYNFSKEALQINFHVPNGQKQGDIIDPMNEQGCVIFRSMNRKRRRYYFLLMMLQGYARVSKAVIPEQYKDKPQLLGVMRAVVDSIDRLWSQFATLSKEIVAAAGVPVMVPAELKAPFLLPKKK